MLDDQVGFVAFTWNENKSINAETSMRLFIYVPAYCVNSRNLRYVFVKTEIPQWSLK